MIEITVTESMKRMGMGHGADTMWIPESMAMALHHHQEEDNRLDEDQDQDEDQNQHSRPQSSPLHENDMSWMFVSEGNGGEMRKSYHAYPKGYAQLIRKPKSFSVTPMQIDTWNRQLMKGENSSKFVPPPTNTTNDFLPKSSQIRNLTKANYNPLLECPCSDRLPKTWGMTYALLQQNHPEEEEEKELDATTVVEDKRSLDNSTECFEAAVKLLPSTNVTTRIIVVPPGDVNTGGDIAEFSSSSSLKGICTAMVHDDGSLDVVWNSSSSSTAYSTDHEGESLDATAHDDDHNQNDHVIMVGTTPTGSIVNVTVVLNTTTKTAEITMKGPYLDDDDDEDRNSDNNFNSDGNGNGNNNDDRWFAIGFGANSMCIKMEADECTTGGPYAIVVMPPAQDSTEKDDSVGSTVVERKLEYHGAGKVLLLQHNDKPQQQEYALTVLSNQIEEEEEEEEIETEGDTGMIVMTKTVRVGRKEQSLPERKQRRRSRRRRRRRRVVRVSRPFEGPTRDYYSFRDGNIHKPLKVILATGCTGGSNVFGRHCGHQSPDPVMFAQVGVRQEIVRDGVKGRIGGRPFQKDCMPEPYGDLVKQNNPTCTVQTYQGGLSCCVHDQFLLDTNQTIPWSDEPLEYRLKFRFYYQDYFPATKGVPSSSSNATADIKNQFPATKGVSSRSITDTQAARPYPSHQDMTRFYWTTEAGAGEYDVPQCEPGTPISQCIHVITSKWKVRDFLDFNDENTKQLSGIQLIYAAPHCHAPVCLSLELYNADTGKLLCRMEPVRGRGSSSSTSTSTNTNNTGGAGEEKYDEEGFIAIPPCLWSEHQDDDKDPSLLPRPDFLSLDTTLMSIKRANSTFPHTGEMASWQMRGLVIRQTATTSSSEKNPIQT